jgi:hypothetical protein
MTREARKTNFESIYYLKDVAHRLPRNTLATDLWSWPFMQCWNRTSQRVLLPKSI